MALLITEECINCGACEPECPNTAIYEGGAEWSMGEGNNMEKSGQKFKLHDGTEVDVNDRQKPISDEFYYIVTDKCTECVGFHEEPQCAAVCPVDCCVLDPDVKETQEELLVKKEKVH